MPPPSRKRSKTPPDTNTNTTNDNDNDDNHSSSSSSSPPSKKPRSDGDLDHPSSLDVVVAPPPPPDDALDFGFFEDEELHAAEAVMATHGDDNDDDDDSNMALDALQQPPSLLPKTKTKKYKRQDSQDSNKNQHSSSTPKRMTVAELKQSYGTQRLARIRKQAIRDAWREYQEESDRVVRQLPVENTRMFGQIGFGKFGKKWFPVLIISPYDVALESVRNEWYGTFEKVRE